MDTPARNHGAGFPGYDGCFPKATRSSRGRGEGQRKLNEAKDCSEDMFFFELLASVAGQLLQERQEEGQSGKSQVKLSNARSSKESVGEKDAVCNHGALDLSADLLLGNQMQSRGLQEEVISNYTEKTSRIISVAVNANSTCGGNSMPETKANLTENATSQLEQHQEAIHPHYLSNGVGINRHDEGIDVVMLDDNHPPLVSSSSEEEPASKASGIRVNLEGAQNRAKTLTKPRDEDGNSSESTVLKAYLNKSSRTLNIKPSKGSRASCAGVKRKRSILKEGEQGCETNGRCGSVNMHRQTKKKMASHSVSVDSFSDGIVDDGKEDKSPASKLRRVKLSIKSFLVPELSIDLPESATVANLKRAVMEAAMNLLGGGLGVRVLLQEKKVLDETISLLQAGISNSEEMESLRFMLEPTLMPTSSTCVDDSLFVLSHAACQPMSWYPGLNECEGNACGSQAGGDRERIGKDVLSKENGYHEAVVPSSDALVPSQTGDAMTGLAIIPFEQKSGSLPSGTNKRRIRRPFSVAEVEALVQAVEKLGTGRWRDVKLHAFGQAKHRTYVDLKDKWKTLVHTASIASYQRRGEPVPQELLDRVTNAHAYWTAHQAVKAADGGS